MTHALYLTDSYLKEFEATVKSVKDKFVLLDNTGFYPNSGGQPYDTGMMKTESDAFKVVFVGKFDGQISHEVDKPGLKEGDKVKCTIDWDRRYLLMRYHTAAHIVSQVIHKETGAVITGNQLNIDKARIDFSLENYDPEKMKDYVEEANQVINQDLKITHEFKPRSEVEQDPTLCRLSKGLPPGIQELRILSIGDFDIQADGGTHVNSTKEVGKLELIKCENKGKNNRRLYFKVLDV